MVDKKREQNTAESEDKENRVKVGKLKLNKETIQDLSRDDMDGIKGGMAGDTARNNPTSNNTDCCGT